MGEPTRRVELGEQDDGRRLDRIVRKAFPSMPMGRIYRALRSGEIRINGKRATGDLRVHRGDRIDLSSAFARELVPAADTGPNPQTNADAGFARIADRLIYRNAHIIVVDKVAGELVHGTPSLEELVRAGAPPSDSISFVPGPAHRLDRNTSGLILFGITLAGAQAAAEAFRAGSIAKHYVALLEGRLTAPETWSEPLERDRIHRVTRTSSATAQSARTLVVPVAWNDSATLAIVGLVTGRTHQIRAHAAIHGHPLLSDRKYGSTAAGRYLLHAATMTQTEPAGVLGFSHVWTPLPAGFERSVTERFGASVLTELTRRISRPR